MSSTTQPSTKRRAKSAAVTDQLSSLITADDANSAKPRARKPRGSKIVTKQQITSIATPAISNVVLNLKCSMWDLKEYNERLSKMIINPLEYNSSAPPEVKFYDGAKPFGSLIGASVAPNKLESNSSSTKSQDAANFSLPQCVNEKINSDDVASLKSRQDNGIDSDRRVPTMFCENINSASCHSDLENWAESKRATTAEDIVTKDTMNKLKQLKIQLYKNALHSEKQSACFWCTYDFDNAPCYIPKYEMDGTIYGYGSFCRPECAVAHLMKETIDDSTKFDRYHLLNQIYSKVYDCKKNIKPAPDPHYLLEKFYGNLSIQEYRKLLKTEHLLLVIDNPLTRILPELHEDTDDAFTKIYGVKSANGNASGVYKVKRQSEQPVGPSKSSIIRNTFGISN